MSLALALADEFNCIGIDNYNHSSKAKISSLKQMAVMYVDLILAHTSISESIHLLGWSLGGQLALEISYLLESRGAKDIKVFLLDSIMNSESIRRLRKQFDMSSSLLKMRGVLYAGGITDKNHIERILLAFPFEIEMAQCEQSGKLHYAEVTLFKAGLVDESIDKDDDVSCQMSLLTSQLPDNNVTRWVDKPITVTLINDKNHLNIIESIEEIKMGILNSMVLDDLVTLS